jgi:3-oxoacyl-[acyl-carrier-protein] synthase-3
MTKMKLTGTGNYLPELIVTNQMMSSIVETSDEWITTRTGISERRLSSGEPTWYMAVLAARKALEAADLSADQLDIIMVTTCTPDYYLPAAACIVQAELGADKAYCFDLNAACSGFVYALDMAARYLQDPTIQNILIVASENISKLVDYSDRSTCVLFGDGASAVVCSRGAETDTSALLATRLGSEGKTGHVLVSRALKVQHPFLKEGAVWPDRFGEHEDHTITMEGQEVFKFAVRVLADSVLDAAVKAGVDITELRYIIPHQANSRIVEAAARRMKADPNQIISRMADFGNTSSASIPICLDELIRSGKLQRGEKVAICGFGAGLTYGAAIFVY